MRRASRVKASEGAIFTRNSLLSACSLYPSYHAISVLLASRGSLRVERSRLSAQWTPASERMTKNASVCLLDMLTSRSCIDRCFRGRSLSCVIPSGSHACSSRLAPSATPSSKTADTQYFIELCASQALNTRTSFICEPGLCLDFNLRHMLMPNPGRSNCVNRNALPVLVTRFYSKIFFVVFFSVTFSTPCFLYSVTQTRSSFSRVSKLPCSTNQQLTYM